MFCLRYSPNAFCWEILVWNFDLVGFISPCSVRAGRSLICIFQLVTRAYRQWKNKYQVVWPLMPKTRFHLSEFCLKKCKVEVPVFNNYVQTIVHRREGRSKPRRKGSIVIFWTSQIAASNKTTRERGASVVNVAKFYYHNIQYCTKGRQQ